MLRGANGTETAMGFTCVRYIVQANCSSNTAETSLIRLAYHNYSCIHSYFFFSPNLPVVDVSVCILASSNI